MTRNSVSSLMGRSFPYLCLALLLIAAAFLINPQRKAQAAATFTVNDTGDTDDAIQGDGVCADSNGKCTLRAAIEEANALAGADTIKFSVTGTIKLTLGELGITDHLTITGLGASALKVDANQASRVFNITGTGVTVTLDSLTIANGKHSSGGDFGGGVLSNVGGGIFNYGGTLTITNSTISNNSASGGTNGTHSAGGGIASDTFPAVYTRNTIIAGNIASQSPDIAGNSTSLGHNLIGKNDNPFSGFTDGINNDQVGTSGSPLDPHLAPLQYYGGPTETLALLPNSPAINAGDDCVTDTLHCFDSNISQLTTDQRGTGFPRKSGAHVDIGAFEFRTVPEQIADLMALIDNFNVKKSVDKKFDHRLDEVLKKFDEMQKALNKGNTHEASNKKRETCQQIAELLKNVQKETGRKLSASEANQIIIAANLISVSLGC